MMLAKQIPDALIELLRYDPATGKLFWIKSPRRGIAPGTEAGKLNRQGYIRVGPGNTCAESSKYRSFFQKPRWLEGRGLEHRKEQMVRSDYR